MAFVNVYLLEMGILQKDPVHSVYDKKHGYYYELLEYRALNERNNVIKEMEEYVKSGVARAYAVLSITSLDDSIIEALDLTGEDLGDLSVGEYGEEAYAAEDVIWSLYKDEIDEIHVNFVKGQQLSNDFPKSVEMDVDRSER